MRKRNLLALSMISIGLLLCPKNTYAITASDYSSRNVCNSKYELAGAHTDQTIAHVGCYNTYNEAKTAMINNGADDLFIFDSTSGATKIVDANNALLDLSVNPETLTYFYETKDLNTRKYTYMDTGSLYGGVDGVLLDVNYNKSVKVMIGGLSAWIGNNTYEIVPLNWVKSSSSYTVDDSIRHNYVAKIQNTYSGTAGSTIGPKPDMLDRGTYYSYDGHYFYKNRLTMIKDYKNNTRNNSVNKNNPYYNYYMFLSNHSKTTYSSNNIDEYIRDNLNIRKDVYSNKSQDNASRLYGQGTFFYYSQEKYGVNALLSLSLSRNESANGRSNLAINKNNGFGLNAVDSNPYQEANWFPTYSSSILEFASNWITDGYADPSDSRYFGPMYGDKYIGMNVKYASDTYWSEKMAANYYSLDRAKGLQDYNYYQLGIVTGPTNAYIQPSAMSQVIYKYPEKDDGVLIVDEIVNAEGTWYKLQSDKIINGNVITTIGDYNWDSFVYVKKEQVTKINTPKNGYQYPKNVFEYQDSKYTYDLYVENSTLKPKVATTTKNTTYYYDPSLTSSKNITVLKDKLVMVYKTAYDSNNKPIAYLITSDYKYDQKDWVDAKAIRFIDSDYGYQTVNISGAYEWVCSEPIDDEKYLIGREYTYSYFPIVGEVTTNGVKWYKIPVSLTSNTNSYGYVLAYEKNATVTKYNYKVTNENEVINEKPIITAQNKSIVQGTNINLLEGVTATDIEDGNITSNINVSGTVDINKVGEYEITYTITDSGNLTTTKKIKITVIENKKPQIKAKDKTVQINTEFNELKGITAIDEEDGDITKNIKVIENTVDTTKVGEYKVKYKVSDSYNQEVVKEIKVTVTEEEIIDNNLDLDNLEEQDGEFYLDNLTYNKTSKEFTISGYLIILNKNNTLDKEYHLVLADKNSTKTYNIEIDSWLNNTPYDLGSENGNSYTNSWFKGKIDFKNIPNGDYDIYMIATDNNNYTKQIVDNFFNQNISRRGEDNNHGYNFKVQQRSKIKQIELMVRDELYTVSEAPTTRNMVNGYDEIKFKNNKLYLLGYSYDYDGVYSDSLSVTRKLILENTSNYNQTVLDLGSTKGPFELETLDKKDKTYAWFEKELDISKLDKGTYSLLIYTKTSNASNYDEIPDMFKSLKEEITINDKTYTISYNKARNNRIELTVK